MKWLVEVLTNGRWEAIRCTGCEPYTYESEEEAERIARTFYPDQWRRGVYGGVRVVPEKPIGECPVCRGWNCTPESPHRRDK